MARYGGSTREIVVVGSLNVDLRVTVPRMPVAGETIAGGDVCRFTGGKGANQAAAAALLGARVLMVGCHGRDGAEQALLRELREKGIDTAGLVAVEGPTGTAIVLVTQEGEHAGENSIVISAGANARVSAEIVEGQRERIAAAAMVLTQLEIPMEAVERTVRLAGEVGVPVMLDPAPARALPPELLRGVTWLTPNETEAGALLGEGVGVSEMRARAERLLGLGAKNVVLKMGARGAYVATSDGVREHVPAPEVQAVDTTAAGDALNGALAVGLSGGADAVEALRFAVTAASMSTTRAGALASLAMAGEVEEFLRRGCGVGVV